MGAFIASHYQHVLDTLLVDKGFEFAILLEDDMVLSPDFLQFFEQLAPLLHADPSLWCISSWNDNGFEHLVSDKDVAKVHRSSFFPGLGWMIHKSVWQEIRDRWPPDHWDHGMRIDSIHRGRQCLYPEISRNHNIGAEGANLNPVEFNRFLDKIAFAGQPDVFLGDVSRLTLRN